MNPDFKIDRYWIIIMILFMGLLYLLVFVEPLPQEPSATVQNDHNDTTKVRDLNCSEFNEAARQVEGIGLKDCDKKQ